jgi:hypothetical protein
MFGRIQGWWLSLRGLNGQEEPKPARGPKLRPEVGKCFKDKARAATDRAFVLEAVRENGMELKNCTVFLSVTGRSSRPPCFKGSMTPVAASSRLVYYIEAATFFRKKIIEGRKNPAIILLRFFFGDKYDS